MVKRRTVVLYPHLGIKAGTGHLKRLLPFFSDIRFDVYIVHRDPDYTKDVVSKFNIDIDRVIPLSSIDEIDKKIDLIILDNRESDRYLYDKLKLLAPIVALDEGGDSRNYVPYTIDMLPNLTETSPNYYNPGLLDLPDRVRKDGGFNRILITFGGQDPFNLTSQVTEALKDRYDITTVVGPLFKKKDFGVEKIDSPKSLKEILYKYDLIITSFGITAFEALKSGVPVALYNPTDYHQKLSLKAGFYTLDSRFHINYKKAKKALKSIDIGYKEKLTDLIYNLTPSSMGCPICKRRNNPVISRFKYKTFYYCNHCTIDYMVSHKEDKVYQDDYFNKEYKEQYGKTYLEDFNHIKSMGLKRVGWIIKRLKHRGALLDIGCAYGPFLDAAKDLGFTPYGIDPSKEGVEYINNHLKINAKQLTFPLSEPITFPTPFNCVTMWYVIEHFKDLDLVLTQVNSLLEKGGVFSFSTPNVRGITGSRSQSKFHRESPDDHFSLLSPKSCKKVLKDYGFKVYKINITGHHPDRFGTWVRGSLIKKIVLLFSRVFGLGDTFEIYAIKDKNL